MEEFGKPYVGWDQTYVGCIQGKHFLHWTIALVLCKVLCYFPHTTSLDPWP